MEKLPSSSRGIYPIAYIIHNPNLKSYNEPMKIAIDARFYGTEHTGLGRYTTNVLRYLPKYLPKHNLQILLRAAHFSTFKSTKNSTPVRAEIEHYSLSEQIRLPTLLAQLKPDLFYTFH